MVVVACAGTVRAHAKLKQIATALTLFTLLLRTIARKLQLFESNVIVTFTKTRIFIRTHDEPLSVAAMRVSSPDRLAVAINR